MGAAGEPAPVPDPVPVSAPVPLPADEMEKLQLFRTGDHRGGVAAYQQCLERDPKNVPMHANMALVKVGVGARGVTKPEWGAYAGVGVCLEKGYELLQPCDCLLSLDSSGSPPAYPLFPSCGPSCSSRLAMPLVPWSTVTWCWPWGCGGGHQAQGAAQARAGTGQACRGLGGVQVKGWERVGPALHQGICMGQGMAGAFSIIGVD
jgi:hypothetical protein